MPEVNLTSTAKLGENMQNLTHLQKHQQFDEFFMIKHNIPVNMRLLEDDFVLPEKDDLHQHMPYEFQIASELSALDTKALRPLRRLGEHAVELAEFLNHQSRKIDLMMSLILQQHTKRTCALKTNLGSLPAPWRLFLLVSSSSALDAPAAPKITHTRERSSSRLDSAAVRLFF